MGTAPPAPTIATPDGSNAGSAINLDEGGPSRWQEHVAPCDLDMEFVDEGHDETNPTEVQKGLGQTALDQLANI